MTRRAQLGVAALLGLGTVVLLCFSSPAVGIPRDEGIYFDAGRAYATWFDAFPRLGLGALGDEAIVRHFQINREHPALPKLLFGLSHRLLHDRLGWTSHATAFRFPAFLFSGLLIALTFLIGVRERSVFAGLFAALAMLAVPRHFFHLQIAAFDAPAAATWLLTVLAYRHAAARPDSWRRGLLAGLAFGLAIAVKHNAYFLPPLLVLHFLWSEGRGWWRAGDLRARLRAIPRAFFAMALVGPALLYLSWPFLWHHPFERLGWYLAFHARHVNYSWTYLGEVLRDPPFPVAYPFVVTALTVPFPLLLASGAGLSALLARRLLPLVAWWRGRRAPAAPTPEVDAGARARRDSDLLLLLCATFPILLIALPGVPIFGGVKHWLHAMPFLFLLAGEAIEALVQGALPERASYTRRLLRLAFTGGVILLPGAIATAHFHPLGTPAYNVVAGGAPGAAELGMQRHYWSNAITELLPWINANAPRGARIFFHEVRPESIRWYQADGRLRADIRQVHDLASASLAVYQYHQEFRDKEFEIWSAFGTQKPVTSYELDGVPILRIYQRPSHP